MQNYKCEDERETPLPTAIIRIGTVIFQCHVVFLGCSRHLLWGFGVRAGQNVLRNTGGCNMTQAKI